MSLKAIALIISLICVPSLAVASPSLTQDHKVFHRWYSSVEADLVQRGISPTSIEEWGELIRVEAKDETGAMRIIFLDKDALRPFRKLS